MDGKRVGDGGGAKKESRNLFSPKLVFLEDGHHSP